MDKPSLDASLQLPGMKRPSDMLPHGNFAIPLDVLNSPPLSARLSPTNTRRLIALETTIAYVCLDAIMIEADPFSDDLMVEIYESLPLFDGRRDHPITTNMVTLRFDDQIEAKLSRFADRQLHIIANGNFVCDLDWIVPYAKTVSVFRNQSDPHCFPTADMCRLFDNELYRASAGCRRLSIYTQSPRLSKFHVPWISYVSWRDAHDVAIAWRGPAVGSCASTAADPLGHHFIHFNMFTVDPATIREMDRSIVFKFVHDDMISTNDINAGLERFFRMTPRTKASR